MRRFSDPFLLDRDYYVLFLYKLCRMRGRRRKIGDLEKLFVEIIVKGIYVQLTLNSKVIWMVRPYFFYSVISLFMLEFIIQIAVLLVLEC